MWCGVVWCGVLCCGVLCCAVVWCEGGEERGGRGGVRSQCAVVDLKRAIVRVEILKVNVHDDQLRFKMQVQE